MNRLLFVTVVALTAAVLAAATPAAAKEGVVARVFTPIARSAEPGAKVKVVWTLYHVEDGERVSFNATGVFIRLFGSGGSHSARVYATQSERGRYRAVVNVPPGGVHRVVIGLMGTSCGPSGCHPSPAIFEIVGRSVG